MNETANYEIKRTQDKMTLIFWGVIMLIVMLSTFAINENIAPFLASVAAVVYVTLCYKLEKRKMKSEEV